VEALLERERDLGNISSLTGAGEREQGGLTLHDLK